MTVDGTSEGPRQWEDQRCWVGVVLDVCGDGWPEGLDQVQHILPTCLLPTYLPPGLHATRQVHAYEILYNTYIHALYYYM